MLFAFQRSLLEFSLGPLIAKSERLVSRLKDYVIPVLPLITDDLEIVTDTFARVNSSGKEVSETDMVRAMTWTREFDLNRQLSQISRELEPSGWASLKPQVMLNTVKAMCDLDIYKADPAVLQTLLRTDPSILPRMASSLRLAIDLLHEWSISGPRSLPYAYQLVGLARAFEKCGAAAVGAVSTALRNWLFLTAYEGLFTGMTSDQLRTSFGHIETIVLRGGDAFWHQERDVTPITRFRNKSVRGQLYALRMAIAGDAILGGEDLVTLYGQNGADSVFKLFPQKSAEHPGNRVIAHPDQLRKIRRILNVPYALLDDGDQRLARALLFTSDYFDLTQESLLAIRSEYVSNLEAQFVLECGGRWASVSESGPLE
jgi:hypothetical protein